MTSASRVRQSGDVECGISDDTRHDHGCRGGGGDDDRGGRGNDDDLGRNLDHGHYLVCGDTRDAFTGRDGPYFNDGPYGLEGRYGHDRDDRYSRGDHFGHYPRPRPRRPQRSLWPLPRGPLQPRAQVLRKSPFPPSMGKSDPLTWLNKCNNCSRDITL